MDVDLFEEMASDENRLVLDTRDAPDFVESHIPNSISMDLDNMGLYAGWVLSTEKEYLFALASPMDLEEAAGLLYRVGIDTAVGYLNGGFKRWKSAGKETTRLPVYSLEKIQSGKSSGDLQLLDVRQNHETIGDSIEDSTKVPLTRLSSNLGEVEKKTPVAAICPGGIRSTTGASILQHAGFKLAGISEVGLKEWKRRGLSTS
jgi:rhodanese-related sulfurtransferase